MVSYDQIVMFSVTSILLLIAPGPDIIYVMTRGIAQGKKAAIAASLGFSLGCVVHTFLIVFGLSKLIATSVVAFQILKFSGAFYLVYLGIKIIRDKTMINIDGSKEQISLKKIFNQSIIANLLNPKVIIFFLAFFPQFINEKRGNVSVQMITLGFLFVLITFVGFSTIGYLSGLISTYLYKKPAVANKIQVCCGSVLILLGVRLAFISQ